MAAIRSHRIKLIGCPLLCVSMSLLALPVRSDCFCVDKEFSFHRDCQSVLTPEEDGQLTARCWDDPASNSTRVRYVDRERVESQIGSSCWPCGVHTAGGRSDVPRGDDNAQPSVVSTIGDEK